MRYIFVLCGLVGVFFLLLKLLPGYQLTSPPLDPSSAGGALSARAVDLLSRAKTLAIDLVEQQNSWKAAAFWLAVGALACTTLATFIAAVRAKESREAKEEFLNKKIMVVGGLAAVATLFSTSEELIVKHRIDSLDKGILTLKRALVSVPADVAATPENQPAILNALEVTLAESES